jgi:hypothetical protein
MVAELKIQPKSRRSHEGILRSVRIGYSGAYMPRQKSITTVRYYDSGDILNQQAVDNQATCLLLITFQKGLNEDHMCRS